MSPQNNIWQITRNCTDLITRLHNQCLLQPVLDCFGKSNQKSAFIRGPFQPSWAVCPFLVIYVLFVNVSSTVNVGEIYCISRVLLLCVQSEYLFFKNYYENINLCKRSQLLNKIFDLQNSFVYYQLKQFYHYTSTSIYNLLLTCFLSSTSNYLKYFSVIHGYFPAINTLIRVHFLLQICFAALTVSQKTNVAFCPFN